MSSTLYSTSTSDSPTTSPQRAATIADVAREAGVSKATAGFVCSGKGRISQETRERVLEVARQLGYEPNQSAKILASGRSQATIGFFSLDVDLSCRTRQMQIIQRALNNLGYCVPTYSSGYSDGSTPQLQNALLLSLLGQKPRAIVCNTSSILPESLRRLERFQEEGGALVCYSYGKPAEIECDQVIFDEQHSFYIGTRHLLELGHRTVGLFSVGCRVPDGETLAGTRRALREFGLEVQQEWLFPNDGELRYEEEGVLLAQRFLKLKKRPTAICVANDYAAAGFVKTMLDAGVDIPGELSVIGCDDDAIAPVCAVPLTTTSYGIDEISRAVIEMVSSRLQGDFIGPPRQVTVRGQLVQRQSCAPPPSAIQPHNGAQK